MFKTAKIWQGTGIELYREGYRGTRSISFEKRDIGKAIHAIAFVLKQSPGSGTYVRGTSISRTHTTIRMEDYQGRKISIRLSEAPEVVEILGKYL